MTADSCKSCGQQITWAKHHESGNSMPLELATEEQIEDGRGLWHIRPEDDKMVAYPATTEDAYGLIPLTIYVSHFSTCPEADTWRSDG